MKALALSALILSAAAAAGCERSLTAARADSTKTAAQTGTAPAAIAIERGRYLIDAVGCHDCHTPKKMGKDGPEIDTSMLLAGHVASQELPPPPPVQKGPWIATGTWDLTAWSGPWGVSYAVNLTPDAETGLGHWTEEMFVGALRTGKHMGVSRPILPPMPWPAFRNMSDADLKAMFAYLRSVPPISNRVPQPVFATEH